MSASKSSPRSRALIFDRGDCWRPRLQQCLEEELNCEVVIAGTQSEALAMVRTSVFDLLIVEGEQRSSLQYALVRTLASFERYTPLLVYSPELFPLQLLEELDHPFVGLVTGDVEELCLTAGALLTWLKTDTSED